MRQRLIDVLDALAGRRTVVIGDIAADEFLYGRVARVSREAPVLILEYDTTEIVPGGAGNAANNVAALGGRAALFGCVGRDDQGARLIEALETAGVDARGVVRVRDYTTTTKTRVLAGGIHSAKQQVVRIDRKGDVASAPARARRLGASAGRGAAHLRRRAHLRLRRRRGDAGARAPREAGAARPQGTPRAHPRRLAVRPGPLLRD